MEKIPKQLRFRPALPAVIGNVDYEREKELLIRIDELLIASGIEARFVRESMVQWKQSSAATGSSAKALHRREELSGVALRSMLLMEVIDESYRVTSQRLAQCPLFQWFCRIDHLGVVKVPSKSTLQRFHKWTELETLKRLNIDLIKAAAKTTEGDKAQSLGLKNAVELETIWDRL
ncbi:transposase [Verrucomicrobia bacterium]|nr:transposase [Verrucomicrobiota bacterium]MDA7657495.1 transposase [Verrucomicrobiota bacterium]